MTQNGQFASWADAYKKGRVPPAVFRVYEKLKDGIWVDRGLYLLRDYNCPLQNERRVFKFHLEQADFDVSNADDSTRVELRNSRQIPSHIKIAVFKRDKGRCVRCGAQDQLHFDHDLPFSKGGTSVLAENVQILCARHNLAKSANVQ